MNDDTPQKGIAVTATGLICQCGNTNGDLMVPHLEIISRRKDVRGQWFEKTKDFLKCAVCGELQLLDEDFVAARKEALTRTPVQVGGKLTLENIEKVTNKMNEILKERAPEPIVKLEDAIGIEVDPDAILDDCMHSISDSKTITEIVDADLDEVSVMKDGSLEVGISNKKYKKKRKKRK